MSDPDANERFTAAAAIPLFLLLAAEGVTLLFLRQLLSVHVFVGILLVVPVALKLATTGWRFLRYYGRDPRYLRRGPPQPLLRLLAPVLVLSTILVLASGIALIVFGPHHHRGVLLLLHKASFVVWGPTFGIHVLVYVWRVPRLAATAAWLQRFAVVGAVGLGVVAAFAGLELGHLHGWFAPDFRDGDGDLL